MLVTDFGLASVFWMQLSLEERHHTYVDNVILYSARKVSSFQQLKVLLMKEGPKGTSENMLRVTFLNLCILAKDQLKYIHRDQ